MMDATIGAAPLTATHTSSSKISAGVICALASFAITLGAATAAHAQSRLTTPPQSATPGQTASQAPGQPKLPSAQEVDAALRRTLGYDDKISWQIIDIRATSVPDLADIVFSVNKQAPQHIYLTSDGKSAIIGELIPFGADPFATARATLASADGPTRGAAKGSIQIVEFSDLQCPHCKAAQPVLDKLLTDFPDVHFVFQQFPLAAIHPWSVKAALYADCVGQQTPDAFWKFADAVFDAQADITVANADEKLAAIATGAGADAPKIAACAATPETDARVKKSIAFGAALGVDQTPTVFINGRKVPGLANIPYEQLKKLIAFEIANAGK